MNDRYKIIVLDLANAVTEPVNKFLLTGSEEKILAAQKHMRQRFGRCHGQCAAGSAGCSGLYYPVQ